MTTGYPEQPAFIGRWKLAYVDRARGLAVRYRPDDTHLTLQMYDVDDNWSPIDVTTHPKMEQCKRLAEALMYHHHRLPDAYWELSEHEKLDFRSKKEGKDTMTAPEKKLVKRPRPNIAQPDAPVDEPAAAPTKKAVRPKAAMKKNTLKAKVKAKEVCSKHNREMIFTPDRCVWECPEPGCRMEKKADQEGLADHVTVLSDMPKLVVAYDGDGDVSYSLFYEKQNIMCKLPWVAGKGHTVFNSPQFRSITINLNSDDFIVVDKDGKSVPLDRVLDR